MRGKGREGKQTDGQIKQFIGREQDTLGQMNNCIPWEELEKKGGGV